MPSERKVTWMSCMMVLKGADLWVQDVSSSMAVSKFFTYSPYIFRNGASFWRMSPRQGFTCLDTDHITPSSICLFSLTPPSFCLSSSAVSSRRSSTLSSSAVSSSSEL